MCVNMHMKLSGKFYNQEIGKQFETFLNIRSTSSESCLLLITFTKILDPDKTRCRA